MVRVVMIVGSRNEVEWAGQVLEPEITVPVAAKPLGPSDSLAESRIKRFQSVGL